MSLNASKAYIRKFTLENELKIKIPMQYTAVSVLESISCSFNIQNVRVVAAITTLDGKLLDL